MKCYGFMLQKGGVGKSSLSGNIAYLLSQNSKKVCLIDADVQGNLTSWLCGNKGSDVKYELADVLQGNVEAEKGLFKINDQLYIYPTFTGSRKLATYKETALFQEPMVLDDLNSELKKAGFDIVIYDTAPGLNQMERSVCFACDEVLAILKPEFFSYDGLEIFEEFVRSVDKAYRKSPPTLNKKLVMNMYNDSMTNHKKNKDRAMQLDYEFYLVPQDVQIEKAQEDHLSLFEFRPNSRAVDSLKKIAEVL